MIPMTVDFGVENLVRFASQTDFPWLMSNAFDNETNRPLGDGKIWHIINKRGKKVCIYIIDAYVFK